MGLSSDLISQFVKTTVEAQEKPQESTTYGTTIIVDGVAWVKLDGSDLLTPVSTTADVKDNERVTVMVKDHTATITGNMSSPSASSEDLNDATEKIENVEADNVIIHNTLQAANAEIGNLTAENVQIRGTLEAANAEIESLHATTAEIGTLVADVAEITNANVENLKATNAELYNLVATYGEFEQLTADQFTALSATIGNLSVNKLDADFANIGSADIGDAAIENLYTRTGLISDITVKEGQITGKLAAVELNADLITSGTLKTDRLIIQGEDGLYYTLNIAAGVIASAELTEEALQNALHGDAIIAHTITADKIAVTDLVAFGATIGGFHLTEDSEEVAGSLYSGVKDSVDNTTRGIYLGSDGQMAVGDGNNYIRFFEEETENENGETETRYILQIAAESILFGATGSSVSDIVQELNDSADTLAANIDDLLEKTEYIQMDTHIDEDGEERPCIILGEKDSDFKVVITNTQILFQDGEVLPAYISNQALHIRQAVIEDNLQQGPFEWKARTNGNLGLVWKGVTS